MKEKRKSHTNPSSSFDASTDYIPHHIVTTTTPLTSKKSPMATRAIKKPKTYNSGYSLVVTHLTTNPR
jgi:hypothetical protein